MKCIHSPKRSGARFQFLPCQVAQALLSLTVTPGTCVSCLVQGSPLESEAFMGRWSGRNISTLRTTMIIDSQHPDVHHLACLASPFIAHEQNTVNQQHSKSEDWQKPPGGGGLC